MQCRSSSTTRSLVTVAIMLVAIGQTVAAQSTPTPGSVSDDVDRPVLAQPDASTTPAIEDSTQTGLKPPSSSKKVQINQFELLGNRLFDDKTLLALIAGYIGQPVSIEQIYEAADSIQQFYRRQGYMLASVYIPAQKISSGTVRLEIIEGRIGGMFIEGDLDSYEPKFLIGQFGTSSIGEVISQRDLEKKILLMNDLPGMSARAVILPGSEYGTSDIALQSVEKRTSTVLRVNNYGRKSLGRTRVEAGWLLINPLSQGDQLNLSAIFAEDSRMTFARVDYDMLLNNSGTRAGIGLSTFDYDVDTQELNLTGTLTGDGVNLRLFVKHPLRLSKTSRVDVSAAIRSSETSEDGSLALSTASKSISLLDLSLNWRATHASGSSSRFRGTFSSNFKDNPDGLETDAAPGKLLLDYSWSKPFAGTWFAIVAANLAIAADPLPDVERYRLGGPVSVRAYPSAEIAGDEGHTLRLDVGKSYIVLDNVRLIVKLFADTGTVERILPAAGQAADESLSGYGVGLSMDFGGKHSLAVELATPTSSHDSSDGSSSRGWLSYSVQF